MFIRKTQVSNYVKKEKLKQKEVCERKNTLMLKTQKDSLSAEHKKFVTDLQIDHKKILSEKDKEIKKLRREINKNYSKYQEIRKREKYLDQISNEVEDILDFVSIKMQESIQPFYRTRAKIDRANRKSNNNHEKVESIFKAVK